MVMTGQATMPSRLIRRAAATTSGAAVFDLRARAFAIFSSNNERYAPTYSIFLDRF